MTARIWTKFRFWSFFTDTQLWPHINEPRAVYESSERGTVNYVDGNHVWFLIFWWQIFFFFLGFFGFDLWCVEKKEEERNFTKWFILLPPQNLKFWFCNGMVGLFWSSGKVPDLDLVGLGSIPSGPQIFFLIPKDNFHFYLQFLWLFMIFHRFFHENDQFYHFSN